MGHLSPSAALFTRRETIRSRSNSSAAGSSSSCLISPYSPDLNPIEMVFAKLKTLLRKADERSIASVWHRIGSLLREFSPTECANYIRHAGYNKPDPVVL